MPSLSSTPTDRQSGNLSGQTIMAETDCCKRFLNLIENQNPKCGFNADLEQRAAVQHVTARQRSCVDASLIAILEWHSCVNGVVWERFPPRTRVRARIACVRTRVACGGAFRHRAARGE